jgi:hypothetical protein
LSDKNFKAIVIITRYIINENKENTFAMNRKAISKVK